MIQDPVPGRLALKRFLFTEWGTSVKLQVEERSCADGLEGAVTERLGAMRESTLKLENIWGL